MKNPNGEILGEVLGGASAGSSEIQTASSTDFVVATLRIESAVQLVFLSSPSPRPLVMGGGAAPELLEGLVRKPQLARRADGLEDFGVVFKGVGGIVWTAMTMVEMWRHCQCKMY